VLIFILFFLFFFLFFKQIFWLGDVEANNYKGVGLARESGCGIPSLLVRDPLPSTRRPELARNDRYMVFMSLPHKILHLPPGAWNTF